MTKESDKKVVKKSQYSMMKESDKKSQYSMLKIQKKKDIVQYDETSDEKVIV